MSKPPKQTKQTKQPRPTLRYHGGKHTLAPWLVSLFPAHRTYVELCCGAASVFMAKPRAYAEVLNDRDDDLVDLLDVLRDPAAAKDLVNLLRLKPYARTEFVRARDLGDRQSVDAVERARRLIVRSFMGFGTGSLQIKDGSRIAAQTGFRGSTQREGSIPPHDWVSYPAHIPAFTQRLQGVIIENRPAVWCIKAHDAKDTLFYADPPYPFSTRANLSAGKPRQGYRFEMSDDDHRELAAALHQATGMVIISGYGCALYDAELYPTWTRLERLAHIDGGATRTEVVWMNEAATRGQGLFGLDGLVGLDGKESESHAR